MSAVIELSKALINRASVTPDDAGCQALIAKRLEAIGFDSHWLPRGKVSNLLCLGPGHGPLLLFLGHTDVVPPGRESAWTSPAFTATERDNRLYGRGAADMKSSVAAFVCACEALATSQPLGIRIGVLLTSDEEGPAQDGIQAVTDELTPIAGEVSWCLVGEPSSQAQLGDVIRIGRRGSLSGTVSVAGQQGHVAYPELADNPVPRLAGFLTALSQTHWDEGTADFPPTGLQITGISTDTDVGNIIPGQASARFNLRFSPASSADALRNQIEQLAAQHAGEAQISIDWHLSAQPFVSQPGALRAAVEHVIRTQSGHAPIANTAGGTSDGRFIAPLGAEVIEFGPVNASIHQVNESINLDELNALTHWYGDIIKRLAAVI